MAKEKMEEKVGYEEQNFSIDEVAMELPLQMVQSEEPIKVKETYKKSTPVVEQDVLLNCLRNERVIVRHIPKEGGMVGPNPKHILSGGMAESAVRYFTIPRLSSGMYVNVLTDDEKTYLEQIMGLEYNALSIYKKVDNYWDNFMVRLTKQDNLFNLMDPDDYIRYKVLLSNKDMIAPSLYALQDAPKATYQFVIIIEGEENKTAKDNMSTTMKCYKEFGRIETEADVLRVIVETMSNRPLSVNEKLDSLHTKINNLIQTDSKMFLKIITDPLLNTKVLIKKSIEAGLIANRGNFLYLRSDNTPLCENNEEPTINIAAKFLNNPKRQDIKFLLEAKLKQ